MSDQQKDANLEITISDSENRLGPVPAPDPDTTPLVSVSDDGLTIISYRRPRNKRERQELRDAIGKLKLDGALPKQYPCFPEIFRKQKIWVWYRIEEVTNSKGEKRPTKVPYVVGGARKASSTDPATWSTFADAINTPMPPDFAGIGIMCTDGYTFIDLDHCREGDDVAPWAADILRRLNSYSEESPSGTGVHVLCLGSLKDAIKKNSVEIYSRARFLTVTGRHIGGTALTVNAADLEAIRADVANGKAGKPAPAPSKTTDDSDSGAEFRPRMISVIRWTRELFPAVRRVLPDGSHV